ncbi:DNA-binding protein [Acidilutibacter cellobiosedens]|uniref:UPF0122 protein EQM13_08300 n=1 Tax=Acidilutibacter cellobiosedens TaxID=2507161 RepID=A0A410QC61_9FIRM|nr:YlxM family DNA-binding protein [Acidilutibacter cellobiosedens]QAT61581.1 DNA-binding protein [Acidilutibacter cellobiosedens]
MEKLVEMGILFDFYGKLLSEKQYRVIDLYYINNFSLAEIGEEINISRQGVYDILKRAENRLVQYEDKLGLVKKFKDTNEKVKIILNLTNDIMMLMEKKKLSEINSKLQYIQKISQEIIEEG